MANYSNLRATIIANITSNGQKAITGSVTRGVLSDMVTALGRGYQYMGIATPTTNPGSPDERVYYYAFDEGAYSHFNNLQVNGPSILYWDTTWHVQAFSTESIQNLSDTIISSPQNKQFLKYDTSLATPKWVNSYVNLTDLNDATIISPSNGQFLKFNGSKWVNSALPSATDLILGGIKVASTIPAPPSYEALSTTGKNYQIQLDTNGKAFVNVPSGTNTPAGVDTLGGIKVATGCVVTAPSSWEDMSGTAKYYPVLVNSAGLAFVNIPWTGGGGATTLQGLTDTDIPSDPSQITNGYALVWNSTAQKWKPTQVSTSGAVTSVVGQTGAVTATQIATALTSAGYKLTDTIYSLPLAASGTRGGIQIGYSENGTNYAVKLSSEKAYVSVPWTDANVTQTATTTSSAYEVLFSGTADNTTRTEGVRKTSSFTYNPSTKALQTGGAINGLTLAASSAGFTIAGGTVTSKTLTVSETLGLTGMNGTTYDLSTISSYATNGNTAYGYFPNGVLGAAHGGTGYSAYTKGNIIYASGASALSLLAPNSTSTKKFLMMTSSTPAWVTLEVSDISISVSDLFGSSAIGSISRPVYYTGSTLAEITDLDLLSQGAGHGYVKAKRLYLTSTIYFEVDSSGSIPIVTLNAPFVTSGDQIVISGTAGGGGGGVTTLRELLDTNIPSTITDGYVLTWDEATQYWIPKAGGGSDTKVTQTATTTDASYEILFSGSANNTTSTEGARKTSTLLYNPSTKALQTGGAINGLTFTKELEGFTISGGTVSRSLTVKGMEDSTSASFIGTSQNIVTERDIYHGLPTINGLHNYSSNSDYYAPTSAGTSGYWLKSSGSGAPVWESMENMQAGKDGDGNTISSTYLKLAGGTMTGAIKLMATYGLQDTSSRDIFVYNSTSSPTLTIGHVGVSGSSVIICSYNNDIKHRKYINTTPTDYAMWDAGNSNLSTVAWACSELSVGSYWKIGLSSSTLHWYYSSSSVANMTSSGVFTTSGDQVISSDISLKTNLQDIDYTVAEIASCRAVRFEWKDGRGVSAGSIAQDWLRIIPELVHGEEGSRSLAYGQIALINTVLIARHEKEQDIEIRYLKERVEHLEREVEYLRSR